MSSEQPVELLQGTLDLLVLRALSTMGPLHAYALVRSGTRALGEQTERCRRLAGLVDKLLLEN